MIQCNDLVCLVRIPLQVLIMPLYMSVQTAITCRNVCVLVYYGCHTRWCQNWPRRLCPVLCWPLLKSLSSSLSLSPTRSLPFPPSPLSFLLSLSLIFYWWPKRKNLTRPIQKEYKTWMNLERGVGKQKYPPPPYHRNRLAFTSALSQEPGTSCAVQVTK